MHRTPAVVLGLIAFAAAGCDAGGLSPTRRVGNSDVQSDTVKDARFAEFVAETAGPMVKKVVSRIDRRGELQVALGEAAAPEDALPLTKSLLAGARKEFPDKAIRVTVDDPSGGHVLTADYHPDRGVRYDIAGGKSVSETPDDGRPADRGSTGKDRRFAEWAQKKAGRYLSYVEADLDRNGRLWFGITREVRPDDLSDLTRSLLEGARAEFPDRELAATVFDPEGERVGQAALSAGGQFHWSK